jgi:hypothetical protein
MLGYEKSQMDDDDMGFSWTFFPEYIVKEGTGKRSRREHRDLDPIRSSSGTSTKDHRFSRSSSILFFNARNVSRSISSSRNFSRIRDIISMASFLSVMYS